MKGLPVIGERPSPRPRLPVGNTPSPYTYAPDLNTEAGRLEAAVVKALRTVYDPELPVSVFDLGLIYAVDVDDDGNVALRMTLTAPNCPVAQALPEQVRQAAAGVEGVKHATIDVVWDPPWSQFMMSEAARLELNL